jgi:hypothetical protein
VLNGLVRVGFVFQKLHIRTETPSREGVTITELNGPSRSIASEAVQKHQGEAYSRTGTCDQTGPKVSRAQLKERFRSLLVSIRPTIEEVFDPIDGYDHSFALGAFGGRYRGRFWGSTAFEDFGGFFRELQRSNVSPRQTRA